jgi:AcrR family transcriptional regulator
MSARTRARATQLAQKTMDKFLGAAEEIFGKHGYEGTTIRAISKRARVNLGTLQHYWGSKRELFSHLFEMRFERLRNEHLIRLRAIEARVVDGSSPEVSDLLRALIEPTFHIGSATETGGGREPDSAAEHKRFYALFGRALMDPAPDVVAEMNRIFGESVTLFIALMRRACPQLSDAELDWRLNCIFGAQGFSLVYAERLGKFFGDEANVAEELAANWMLHFLLNGTGAPPFAQPQQLRPRDAVVPVLVVSAKRPGRAAQTRR